MTTIIPGQLYRHYKGSHYRVVDLAKVAQDVDRLRSTLISVTVEHNMEASYVYTDVYTGKKVVVVPTLDVGTDVVVYQNETTGRVWIRTVVSWNETVDVCTPRFAIVTCVNECHIPRNSDRCIGCHRTRKDIKEAGDRYAAARRASQTPTTDEKETRQNGFLQD